MSNNKSSLTKAKSLLSGGKQNFVIILAAIVLFAVFYLINPGFASKGNLLTHAILRGYTDFAGKNVSNYHYEDLAKLYDLYAASGLKNPSVIIDTNHSNSGKKYLEQVRIAKDIVHSRNQNPDIKRLVKGLMIESYLEDGAQCVGEGIFGRSITDPCLGWEKTERLILDMAELL